LPNQKIITIDVAISVGIALFVERARSKSGLPKSQVIRLDHSAQIKICQGNTEYPKSNCGKVIFNFKIEARVKRRGDDTRKLRAAKSSDGAHDQKLLTSFGIKLRTDIQVEHAIQGRLSEDVDRAAQLQIEIAVGRGSVVAEY